MAKTGVTMFLVLDQLVKKARFVCESHGTVCFRGNDEHELLLRVAEGYANAFGHIVNLQRENKALRDRLGYPAALKP